MVVVCVFLLALLHALDVVGLRLMVLAGYSRMICLALRWLVCIGELWVVGYFWFVVWVCWWCGWFGSVCLA